ncbi:hypothetical protein E4U35_006828 [Claviceps purpurea]|nr:hypothetical protein E4U35_006828 [Claviceps purpurea]KAG6203548.1 hypothetical protein E4U50_005652 [Claviceps purpurea]KAG6256645.1 hypothetical protein E4U49_006903 [Claviceps purpurea]
MRGTSPRDVTGSSATAAARVAALKRRSEDSEAVTDYPVKTGRLDSPSPPPEFQPDLHLHELYGDEGSPPPVWDPESPRFFDEPEYESDF